MTAAFDGWRTFIFICFILFCPNHLRNFTENANFFRNMFDSVFKMCYLCQNQSTADVILAGFNVLLFSLYSEECKGHI